MSQRYVRQRGFSLIELVVVISIILLLIGILLGGVNIVKSYGRATVCKSNLRQLVLACDGYASHNNGSFVPGGYDIYTDNKQRWYGQRTDTNSTFDPSKGPLFGYLGEKLMRCPEKVSFRELAPSEAKYDAGSGGYGYNMIYIGSRIWSDEYDDPSCKVTARDSDVKRPAETLMFADTAMAMKNHYVEYSFAEPRYFVVGGIPDTSSSWSPDPSIHFRHRQSADVGWVDGHVTAEKSGGYNGVNEDGSKPGPMDIGWFEPMDNSLFDLK